MGHGSETLNPVRVDLVRILAIVMIDGGLVVAVIQNLGLVARVFARLHPAQRLFFVSISYCSCPAPGILRFGA